MLAKYQQCWDSVLLKQTPPSPERVSTLQSIKDTTSTLQDAPISAKDNATNILLQKDAEASTSARDKNISLPSDLKKLSIFESKKPELSKSPTKPRVYHYL